MGCGGEEEGVALDYFPLPSRQPGTGLGPNLQHISALQGEAVQGCPFISPASHLQQPAAGSWAATA